MDLVPATTARLRTSRGHLPIHACRRQGALQHARLHTADHLSRCVTGLPEDAVPGMDLATHHCVPRSERFQARQRSGFAAAPGRKVAAQGLAGPSGLRAAGDGARQKPRQQPVLPPRVADLDGLARGSIGPGRSAAEPGPGAPHQKPLARQDLEMVERDGAMDALGSGYLVDRGRAAGGLQRVEDPAPGGVGEGLKQIHSTIL